MGEKPNLWKSKKKALRPLFARGLKFFSTNGNTRPLSAASIHTKNLTFNLPSKIFVFSSSTSKSSFVPVWVYPKVNGNKKALKDLLFNLITTFSKSLGSIPQLRELRLTNWVLSPRTSADFLKE